jgi:hypothetical protein
MVSDASQKRPRPQRFCEASLTNSLYDALRSIVVGSGYLMRE